MNLYVFACLYVAAVSLGLLSPATPALRAGAQPGHAEQTNPAGGGATEVSIYTKHQL